MAVPRFSLASDGWYWPAYLLLVFEPLVAQYIELTPNDTTPATEDMNTILPHPEDLSRGCASWLKWYADSKLVEMWNEKSSAVFSIVGFTGLPRHC